MKLNFILLICIALALISCAQMQQSMKGRNDKALKRDLELSHISVFTQRAGGGEKAVGEFQRINMLMLADREATFKSFSGRTEKRKCQTFASRFSNRAQQFLRSNWKDEPWVMAFFIQIPKSYDQVKESNLWDALIYRLTSRKGHQQFRSHPTPSHYGPGSG